MNDMLNILYSQSNTELNDTGRIKEAIQRLAVCSLSDSGFFEKGAFVGGTALRLYHDLDRFSEDIGLTLLEPDPEFSLKPHLDKMAAYFGSAGLSVQMKEKDKSFHSKMKSAFIKGNSKEIHLSFGADIDGLHFNEVITVKLELDVDPPSGFGTEWKYGLTPYPHNVRLYDLPTMHACKIHAILCRNWGNRVKGRDYYDFLYYLSCDVPVNTGHLIRRLEQTGITVTDSAEIAELLRKRFTETDYKSALSDVDPFVMDDRKLRNWSPELFVSLVDRLRFV